MGIHIAGGIIVMVFGLLMMIGGAVKAKKQSIGQGVMLIVGGFLILGGSGWLWYGIDGG